MKLVGYCAGNFKYAVKRERDGKLLPLAEWIGHSISRACGIATPDFLIVECMDGELAFGSLWEPASIQIKVWDSQAQQLVKNHADTISEILGLDYFLPNPDRHMGNFIFAPRAGIETCLSFDFSLANVRDGLPFGAPPLKRGCNTMGSQKTLNLQIKRFNKHKFNSPLNILKTFPSHDIAKILDKAPAEWYAGISKSEILQWWDSAKNSRIAQVAL